MVKPHPVQTNPLEKEEGDSLSGTKGKQVLRPVVQLTLRPPTKDKADLQTGTGSNKARSEVVKAGGEPDEPSRPNARLKSDEEVRSNATVESEAEVQGGVDLSGKTYVGGSRLDPILVPKARNQACGYSETDRLILTSVQTRGYCDEHSIEDCYPTWQRTRNGCDIRCQSCIDNKKGCSFRKKKFGIVKWP